jgi:hypothetical protein
VAATGFEFPGCDGGAGKPFTKELPTRDDYTIIGTIPVGQVGLTIKLEAATDLDINIYDYSGGVKVKRVVGYCGTAGCDLGTCTQTHTSMHKYIYAHTRAHTRTHTHTHTNLFSSSSS